jgi:hypothetical protein
MYTNPYLAEKLISMHRDDLLREAASERMKAQFPHYHRHFGWQVATTIGALLIRAGSWLERSAPHNEPPMLDSAIDKTTGAA